MQSISYGEYHYPKYAEAVGWLLCVSSVIFIPIVALYQIYASKLPFIEVSNLIHQIDSIVLIVYNYF